MAIATSSAAKYRGVAKVEPCSGGVAMQRVEAPELRSGEVRIKVAAAGICGTDLAILKWPEWLAGRAKNQFPRVLGHEFCGHVCEIGSDVDPELMNAYVAVESHIACGHCRLCRNEQSHICENVEYVGIDIDGGFAPYVAVPATLLHRLPVSIPINSAAALEPFALATRAVLDEPVGDRSMLVTGLGPLGVMTMLIAAACGAASITGVERSPYRLRIAKQILESVPNATVFDSSDLDIAEALGRRSGRSGFGRWVDWSGSGQALELGVSVLARGGTGHLLGSAEAPVALPLSQALMKEISFRTLHGRNPDIWPVAIELLSSGAVDLSPLITHTLDLASYSHAFELLQEGKAGKVILTPESI